MRTSTAREIAGLRVVLTGGTDGKGGGQGPLVVLLHGFGAPGTDLVPLSQVLSAPAGTRFAFPHAPLSLGGGFGGPPYLESRAWWMIDLARMDRLLQGSRSPADLAVLTQEDPPGMAKARTQLVAAIEELVSQLQVPPNKLFLGGFSQGAMLSLDVALRSPLPLAGLLLMSGTYLCKSIWQPLLSRCAGLPVVQSHGSQDAILPVELARMLREDLRAAGATLDFVEFSGGHEIPPPVLTAVSRLLARFA